MRNTATSHLWLSYLTASGWSSNGDVRCRSESRRTVMVAIQAGLVVYDGEETVWTSLLENSCEQFTQ